MKDTGMYLLLFVGMSLTAMSGLVQHRYYGRTVRRLAREHDEPGCVLVSGRGKGRVRGAIAVLVVRKDDEVIRAAAVMEGATVPARFTDRPDWVGLSTRDDLPRCPPRVAQAVADARTRIPGRRRPAAEPRTRLGAAVPPDRTGPAQRSR